MRRRTVIVLGIVAVVLIAAAITVLAIQRADDQGAAEPAPQSTQPPTLSQEPAPPPEDPPNGPAESDMSVEDRAALESVAVEAATIMTTWDPGEDFNQTSAELRAADLMTDERAEQVTAPERPATGTEWLEAAEAGATSEPTVEVNEGTESDVVSVIATWVWLDADGHVVSNPDERRAFYFNVEEVNGELLITDYQWETL